MLNNSSNEESKFATKKWYVIDSQTAKDKYNESNSIKFETETIKASFCDYFDAFILVSGDITVNAGNDKMLHVKIVNHFLHVRPCNLIEYSDNYSDTSGSLWQFKRDEVQLIMMI